MVQYLYGVQPVVQKCLKDGGMMLDCLQDTLVVSCILRVLLKESLTHILRAFVLMLQTVHVVKQVQSNRGHHTCYFPD
jgi:hypothetical protein